MTIPNTAPQPRELRYYQREAIDAAYNHLRTRKDNPCIVLPTGGGKTAVMASICRDVVQTWNGRVLVLSHVKELIEQTVSTLQAWYPSLSVGAYSAGLGRRDTKARVLVAGIQSVHNKGLKLAGCDPFNIVLVDEAHRIPTDGDGMYRSLLTDLSIAAPSMRVIGLTATPYRLGGGYVCSDEHFLNSICYEVGVRELIAKGYLSKLTSKHTKSCIDTAKLGIRKGEYKSEDMSAAFGEQSVVDAACQEIVERTTDRKSILLFCCDVEHAENVATTLASLTDQPCGIVTGKTAKLDRERTIEAFKSGRLRWLVNVNVLTEGFDATRVDCVCLLRSTLSPGLYYQMVGRGLRTHADKSDCLILDFGGNVDRHGCIDAIKIRGSAGSLTGEPPTKTCPECDEFVGMAYARCPECGYEFPPPEPKGPNHDHRPSNAPITSDQVEPITYQISEVGYMLHVKRDADPCAPRTMRVSYYDGLHIVAEEWVCIEHKFGFPAQRASSWWRKRSAMDMPHTVDDAIRLAHYGMIAEPRSIVVVKNPGDRFAKITEYELEEIPPARGIVWRTDESGVPWWELSREPGEDDEPITRLADDDDDILPF